MYLHLGEDVVVRRREIIGIFDMDNTTVSPHTRSFLKKAEKKKQVTYVSMDLPKSFVVCAPRKGQGQQVFIAQVSPATLKKRARGSSI
ncbi:MAG: DUF370 domain-containing protein [Clostridia bacterium]|nr:DUF370 domain-containing protein [Clostridia bacterium]